MTDIRHLPNSSWLTDHGADRVMAALGVAGEASRFVGGAVRDTLLGRAVGDIDIATTLLPDAVLVRLKAADIRAIPTGIAHGTITALGDGRGFEITSLRADVETDGRHAVVAFGRDWSVDAARRDFTVNALYADPDGTLHDPTGLGLDDLAARRLRFIGDPETRIREDHLRILRLFRFMAQLGFAAGDSDLDAASRLAPLLPELSAERIWAELGKLLSVPDPAPIVRRMAVLGVWPHLLDPQVDPLALEKLGTLERGVPGGKLRRLAALLPDQAGVAQRLKMSNADADRLAAIGTVARTAEKGLDPIWHWLRRFGADVVTDGLLVAAARDVDVPGSVWPEIAAWTAPAFPISGGDALKLGVPAGPAVGRYLAAVEAWWEAGGCRADRGACLARLKSDVTAAAV